MNEKKLLERVLAEKQEVSNETLQEVSNEVSNEALFLATRHGDLGRIKLLVQQGADIHAKRTRDSALRVSDAKSYVGDDGFFDAIQYFIDRGDGPFSLAGSLLSESAKHGHLDIVEYLLEQGVDEGQSDIALCFASSCGYLDVVKCLVEHGANIHAFDTVALRKAAENGHLDIVKYLFEQGADIHVKHDEALEVSAKKGHLDLVKYLVQQGMDTKAISEAMWLSAFHGHLDVVKYLVEQGADIHTKDDIALCWAAIRNHQGIVEYLIAQGANIHARNDLLSRIRQRRDRFPWRRTV